MPIHPVPDPSTTTTALAAVAEALQIGRSRAVPDGPNAFVWWIGPGMRQRVSVESGPPDDTPWLRIETPVWRGADPDAIAPLLYQLCRHGHGSGVLHEPDSGDVALVTRAPLPRHLVAVRAAALAGTGAIHAFLAAWAWAEARTKVGHHASWWRDTLPHPERGMDVAPDRVLGYRQRVLQPQAEARSGTFADTLFAATADAIGRGRLDPKPVDLPDEEKRVFAVDLGITAGFLEVRFIRGGLDGHALGVSLIVPVNLDEPRARACSYELLRRQLAPGAGAWTLGSWMPIPNRDGRPIFGLTHGLTLPLALADPDMAPELADAAAHMVDGTRFWLDDGAPTPLPRPAPAGARERLVA
jgi:hypothetical protein